MTKLITLIDGSDYSESVCKHTAWVAGRTDASIEILHVLGRRDVSSEPANLSGNIGLGARTALLEELAELDAQKAKLSQKRGRMILEEAKALINSVGIEDVSTKLRNGDILDTIQEFETDADLIVVGKRGEAADFAKLHLGSNLERVVRSSHKPVLVASRSFTSVERFLIAFDGGPSAIKAVEEIANGNLFRGLECQMLMVRSETKDLREQIEAAADVLRGVGYTVKVNIEQGQSDDVIAKRVETDGINLLVMGAYGHSRIRSLIIGSTTTEMVRSCKIPVLLFR
jgi:nucleotide-binding universal stress UspA family protein